MKTYIEHDQDGRIIRVVHYPLEDGHLYYSDCLCLEGIHQVNSKISYVHNKSALVERPLLDIEIQGLNLSRLPVGGCLTIEGTDYPITESTAELKFDLPGKYTLHVRCWPYQDWERVVDYSS